MAEPSYSTSTTYGSPREGSVSPRKWRRGWRRSPLPHSLEQIVPAFILRIVRVLIFFQPNPLLL